MSLGGDNGVCKQEFIDAMRARLATEVPDASANVDLPGVQKNFGALAQAVFRILEFHAEVSSDKATDPAFWGWVEGVGTWLAALSTWQKGVAVAFQQWTPATQPEQGLKAALIALTQPGDPPLLPAPTALKGEIQ